MAGKIITVANQKGGVGKSTLTHLLAHGFKDKGYSVLAVDLDIQGNLTYALNVDEPNYSTYDLLTNKATAQQIRIQLEGMDVLPANSNLAGIDLEVKAIGKEYRLKNALKEMQANYDYIIIDTPPTLSLLTVNALTASDYVLIPTQADIFSLQGLGQLYGTIQAVQDYTNPELQIAGIIVTRHNTRTILAQEITEMLESTAKDLDTIVFKARIREAVAIKEAQAQRTDFLGYASSSKAKDDVRHLIDEILNVIQKGK